MIEPIEDIKLTEAITALSSVGIEASRADWSYGNRNYAKVVAKHGGREFSIIYFPTLGYYDCVIVEENESVSQAELATDLADTILNHSR